MKKHQAQDNRDALSKTLYERLFNFLVGFMNEVLEQKEKQSHQKRKVKQISTHLGVLDIFGFENFSLNSLEQLLINYTNEKLKTFSMLHLIKIEQEMYAAEKLQWTHIEFQDDTECLSLFEGRFGLFSLLDGIQNCFYLPFLSQIAFSLIYKDNFSTKIISPQN